MSSFFLGIDIGTSLIKALVSDEEGKEVAIGIAESKIYSPEPLSQEQDLEDAIKSVVLAVKRALRKIDKKKIKAISFSSAMHGFMPVDKNGKPLLRMMTWADARSVREVEALDTKQIYLQTGCPASALYYPARIVWLKKYYPDIFKRTRMFVSIKDAILHRMIGEWVVDRSYASSNGLLDIKKLDWNSSLLESIGISEDRLPRLVDPDSIVGELGKKNAEMLGLPSGIHVVAGAGDGGLANLGSGAVEQSQCAITIGSTGALRRVFQRPFLDRGMRIFCYYLASGRWFAGGAINNGGIILRWLRDGILSDVRDNAIKTGLEPYAQLLALAEKVKRGAEGLIFLPYVYGERTPYWNPLARGVLFGLAPHHNKAHIARAALEGITMCIAHIFEIVSKAKEGVEEIRASGGFVRSEFWLKLLSDVLGKRVSITRVKENSAMGAIILAMKAEGLLKSLNDVSKMIQIERFFEPDLKAHIFYKERLFLFKDLYAHLEKDFERLAKF